MPETEIFRGKIEFDDNADQAAKRIDGLRGSTLQASRDIDEGARTIGDRVRGIGAQFETLDAKSKRVLSGTLSAGVREFASGIWEAWKGTAAFKTEVVDFSSAAALMMETPKRGLGEFISIARVGLAEVRGEGGNLAIGLRTIARAAAGASQEVFGFERGARVMNTVANLADKFTEFFNRAGLAARNVDKDLLAMTGSVAKMGNALRVQTVAWRAMHTEQIAAKKEELLVAQATLESIEEGTDAYAEQQAVVRALSQEYAAMDELQSIQGKQIGTITNSMLTLNNSMRRLQTNYQATGQWSKQYASRAKLDISSVEREMERLVRMGAEVPPALRKNYEALVETFQAAESRARQLESQASKTGDGLVKASEKSRSGFLGLRKAAGDTSRGMRDYGASTREAAESNKMLLQYVQPEGITSRGFAQMGSNATRSSASVQEFSMSLGSVVGVAAAVGGILGEMNPAFSAVIVGVSKMADQFSRSLSAMASVTGSNTQKMKAMFGVLSSSLLGFGTAALGTIVKAGMVGAEVKTLEITLRQVARNLAKQAGADMDKFGDYVLNLRDKIVETGITTREATNALAQFLRAKLPIGRVEELADAAKNLGVTVANMSSSEVFGRFIEFIQTGNSALLDAIGVSKNASVMMAEYAKSIGKTTKTLTVREQQEALIQGIIKETETVQGVYNEAMKTAGKQLSSMKRYFEEAILVIGRRFEPLLAQVVAAMNNVLKAFNDLSPEVHDNIAALIKWVAIGGTLLGTLLSLTPALKAIIPVVRMLIKTIGGLTPQALLIGVAIGIVVAAVKAFKTLWDQNFGGIQDSVRGLIDVFMTQLKPIIDEIRYWFGIFAQEIGQILTLVTERFKSFVTGLTNAFQNAQSGIGQVFTTIKDIIVGVMRAISHVLVGFQELLRGEGGDAFVYFKSAAVNVLTSLALFFKNFVAKAATWGWNLIVQFANGITKAGSSVLAKVMSFIGRAIGRFIKPGSPPKEGPLSYIAEWGRGIMDTYLRAFGLADFGALKDIMAPIQQALEDAVAAGTMEEIDVVPALQKVRQSVAGLLAEFRQTGRVNEETMANISDTLGEGGQDISEYIRRLMAHQKALRGLQEAQKDYAGYEAAGFVPAEVKAKLQAAEEEARQTEEAVNWQKEYLAAQKDTIDLQLKQLQLLEKMADALASGGAGAAEALAEEPLEIPVEFEVEPVAPEDLWPDDAGGKLGLGQVSEDFVDMKQKIEDAIQAIKDWWRLPWGEKVTTITDKIKEITGIDLAGWWDDNKESVQGFIDTEFTQWWTDLKDSISESWNNVKPHLETMKKLLSDLGIKSITLKGIFQIVMKVIGAAVMVVFRIVKGVISGVANAFDNIIGAFTGAWQVIQNLILGIIDLFTGNIDGFKEHMSGVWEGLKTLVSNAIGGIVDLFMGFIGGALPGVATAISGFVENIKTWFEDTKNSVVEKWNTFWDSVSTKVTEIVDAIVSTISTWYENVTTWVSNLVTTAKDSWDTFWSDLWQKAIDFTANVVTTLSTWYDDVTTWISDIVTSAYDTWVTFWSDLGTLVTDEAKKIVDKILGIKDTITEGISDFIDVGKSILTNIWDGIVAGWENFKQNITDKWAEFKEMLPFSEPKNPASPFYGLGKAGAAIMKNIADGMTGVDLSSQFAVQMAGMVDGLAAAPVYNRNMQNSYNFHPGSLVFPNVTDRTRGESFGQQFRRAMSEADLRRRG